MSERQLNRATLDRQLLLAHAPVDLLDAVRRVVAIQSQEPASAYIALWARVAGFDPADLDAAFTSNRIVRGSLLRITLHIVDAEQYTSVHAAMAPNLRASRVNDRRFTSAGHAPTEADALVPRLLELTDEPRTPDEIRAALGEHVDGTPEWLWWALRTYAPIVRSPTGGPWSFGGRIEFRRGPTQPPPPDHVDALADLFRRYLVGYGPATAQDFGQFALQRRPAWLAAIERLGDALITGRTDEGRTLYDVAGAIVPDPDEIAPPRLLPMWDNVLFAYADRSRVIPEAYRPHIIRRNGDTLPTMLVDGRVAGVWRVVDAEPGPTALAVEATAFHPLPDETWHDLAAEARSLLAMVGDRDPSLYRRYGRWWQQLPDGDTRLIATRDA